MSPRSIAAFAALIVLLLELGACTASADKPSNAVIDEQQRRHDETIKIMAGGGIRASNVRTVALMTGVREVHTSLSKDVEATPSDGGAEFGARLNSHKSFRVLEHDVRAFKLALDAIAVEAKAGARLQ